MKGDGIYSRYFSPAVGGPGMYTFDVTVTDNGNTAYSWQHETRHSSNTDLKLGKLFSEKLIVTIVIIQLQMKLLLIV